MKYIGYQRLSHTTNAESGQKTKFATIKLLSRTHSRDSSPFKLVSSAAQRDPIDFKKKVQKNAQVHI
jgi:hypothetical protein